MDVFHYIIPHIFLKNYLGPEYISQGSEKLLPLHSAVLPVQLVWILIHLFSHLTSLLNFLVVFRGHWGTATKHKKGPH